MTKNNLKIAGFAGLGLTIILLFVAWERYSTNAEAVEAANRMMQSGPMGDMMGGLMQEMTGQSELKPSVPAATTYSLFFAAVSGVAGVACLAASGKKSR